MLLSNPAVWIVFAAIVTTIAALDRAVLAQALSPVRVRTQV